MKAWLKAYTAALLVCYPEWSEPNADRIARSMTTDFLALVEEPVSLAMAAACRSLNQPANRAGILAIINQGENHESL